jgi:peptide/nickel transport system substrate-binding protein
VEELLKTNPDVQINAAVVDLATIIVGFNLENPKFQDERVRQAISLGMDRDQIIDIRWGRGLGKTLDSVPWGFLFDTEPRTEQLGPWSRYDPAEAKKLLAAAGAERLSFTMLYSSTYAGSEELTTIYAEQLKQIGVNVQPQNAEYNEFISQWTGKNVREAAHGWTSASSDANQYFYNEVFSKSVQNRWKINDPQIDEWAVKQRGEMDAQARRGLHRQISERIHQRVYRIPSQTGQTFNVYQPWLRGVRFGGTRFTNGAFDWGQHLHRAWIDK